jgi:hypothetical protein
MKEGLFDGVLQHRFAQNICFLCGAKVEAGEDTVEHVIPKWVQGKFDLWNVRIHLLNGTLIRYRDLVIPCCPKCNNEHLARVEQQVSQCILAGAQAVRAMDRIVLMQWLLKIFFGFLYREIFLPLERARPDEGTIVTAEDMEQFQLLHYMLQSVRVLMRFSTFGSDIPASIFVFEVKEPEQFKFDYKDDVIHRCMCLRLGRVGILVAFDMGAQAVEGAEFFPKYYESALHPVQFDELAANLFAKARKFEITPKVMFAESPSGISFDVLPFTASLHGTIFGEVTPNDVGEFLWRFTRLPRDVVLPEPGRRITFLTADDRLFRDIPIDGYPSTTEPTVPNAAA